jgi:hypothetical protein
MDSKLTVGDVLTGLVRHPVDHLIRRWNWKSAVMSAWFRGTLFFITNISAGLTAALSAMTLESVFYISTAGFYGAMTQAFRQAQPPWAATLAVMVMQPIINHSLEFALHWIGGTEKLARSITASICFSLLSAIFNLFAMRRGALIVGEECRSLIDDLRQMPLIIREFITAIPRTILRRMLKKDS